MFTDYNSDTDAIYQDYDSSQLYDDSNIQQDSPSIESMFDTNNNIYKIPEPEPTVNLHRPESLTSHDLRKRSQNKPLIPPQNFYDPIFIKQRGDFIRALKNEDIMTDILSLNCLIKESPDVFDSYEEPCIVMPLNYIRSFRVDTRKRYHYFPVKLIDSKKDRN